MKFSISGVLVDPISRATFGGEIFVENKKIVAIERRHDVNAPYILPGLIDSHVHIESSMLIPSRFAEMAVKHGTTAIVTDPHEVANVAGEEGVRFMVNNAKTVPFKFYFGVPSCVPASPFEKSGAILDSDIVERLIREDDFSFLAEMMNFPGVVNNDEEVMRKIRSAIAASKPVDGHAPGVSGEQLRAYAKAGISTDHECSNINEALEKLKAGIKIQIREGSAARNFDGLIDLIKNHKEAIMFCTDDCHPDYLQSGHINKLLARAVNLGYNIYDILHAICINPRNHYALKTGALQVNDPADFIVVDDLKSFDVSRTFIDGEEVYRKGEISIQVPETKPPSFHFRSSFKKGNLEVLSNGENINIIGVIKGELLTEWIKEKSPVPQGGIVKASTDTDLLKIVLLDRYDSTMPVVAFIRGFKLKSGALASSIAHDSHHIIAVGVDDDSIDSALSWIVNNRGGLCYAADGKVSGIRLPYYGLMTDENGISISRKYKELNNIIKESGCGLDTPFMTLSFMGLTVIPQLKIYHKGLFDGVRFMHTTLFE